MHHEELEYYLALYLSEGVGAKRAIQLRQYFGSAEAAFNAPQHKIEKIEGFGKSTSQSIKSSAESSLASARQQIEKLGDRMIVTYFDDLYPESLRSIYSAPALLFAEGNLELLTRERKVAVIGTRKITDYGKRATKDVCEPLVRDRAVIVSGFARGVDTHAHAAALEAGGETIAVLGSGLDVIYPQNNKTLHQEMLTSGRGLILSELPMGAQPDARNFPWRNRIVSGLSRAVVVIESDEHGGSMITASLALDQNRDIFAIPGDISRPTSRGPNRLIQESSAKLVRSGEDVTSDLGWSTSSKNARKQAVSIQRTALNLFENKIVDSLEAAGGPLHIDTLAERTEIGVQDLLVQLLGLEFKMVVRQLAGKQFTLVSG
jgi:DNA processing protein